MTTTPTQFGAALAMRVLQSDLYGQLDDLERAECDELTARHIDRLKGEIAQPATPEPAEPPLTPWPSTEEYERFCRHAICVIMGFSDEVERTAAWIGWSARANLATQASALQAAIPAQQPAVEPAAYRILERGEPIQATDEFLEEDATTWTRLDVHPITAGLFVGMPHAPGVLRPGRRPLASPTAQPDRSQP